MTLIAFEEASTGGLKSHFLSPPPVLIFYARVDSIGVAGCVVGPSNHVPSFLPLMTSIRGCRPGFFYGRYKAIRTMGSGGSKLPRAGSSQYNFLLLIFLGHVKTEY